MYFNRPVVKAEVKRSIRQTRPHPMLVTLLFLVISSVGAWLISWLVNTVGSLFSGEGPSLTDIFLGILYYGEEYLEYLLEYFVEMIVQAMMISLVISVLTTAWNGLMNTGYAGYCLNMSRDMNPPLEHIFSGFPRAGSVILAYILVAIFTFLWTTLFTVGLILLILIASLLAAAAGSSAVGSVLVFAVFILYVAALIWVNYRYAMVPFILADSQSPMPALDAIRASKNMMRGRKGNLFVLRLSFIGWYLLEGLIVSIGFIVAIYSIVSSIGSTISWIFEDVENFLSFFYPILSGDFAMLTELFIPAIIVVVVCGVIIFIINLWLTPYRIGCEAHFYLCALGGGQPDPYQSNPYGGQPGPYGGQPGPYNSQPSQYGGQPGPYDTPYSYQPPSQSTSDGYAQGSQPSQYGAAPWGAPQAPQASEAPPVTPEAPEAADAPYEEPYADPAAPGDDDTSQKPDGSGDSQI